ncbi:Endoglucanase precursor [Planococcus massiliensis]|uniref:Endoglucanase n=1 Tax=Planococcus massiliensis TaxID=1499687 RepID=A0A098EL81_9BACL|nr:S-layer homology domain-containing protein [Planococcus massiliensis]CEG22555.1 Endoglucanase precursor [Planococcus massiliensis]
MIKKFFTYAAAAAMTFSLIVPVSSLAAETAFTEVSPANAATDVYRNATLETVVQNGETVEAVEFMQGDFKDVSTAGIKAKSNVAGEEKEATDANKAELAADDGKYYTTSSDQGDSFQTFEVDTGKLEKGGSAEINWQGKTLPDSTLSISIWDHSKTEWVKAEEKKSDSKGSEINFSIKVSDAKFMDAGKILVKVQNELKNTAPSKEEFSLLWFTDTQFYARLYPENWDKVTDFIIDQYNKDRFEYVINTGDLVDTPDSEKEWAVAKKNLDRMDAANIPYGVLAGNHDVQHKSDMRIDYTYFHKYAGADRFEGKYWYGENMNNNQNHYDLMTLNGHEFIFVYLGFGLENKPDTLAWANRVLAEHADKNAVLNMHQYLAYDGSLDPGIPTVVYNNVVVPNENVKLVLSGHFNGAKKKISKLKNEDGSNREVLQVMGNYQGVGQGGDGYLRFVDFKPETEEIEFTAISAITGDIDHYEPEDSFTGKYDLVDWEPSQEAIAKNKKEVSTDYVSAEIFKEKEIGIDEELEKGKASVEWKNLEQKTKYFWYMNAYTKDSEFRSAIYEFTTGTEIAPPTPDPDPGNGGGTTPDPGTPGGGGTTPDPGTPGGGGTTPDPGTPGGGGTTPDPGTPGGGGTTPDPGTPGGGGTTPDPGTPGGGGSTPTPDPGPAPITFTDVAQKYMPSVTYLIREDITKGYSDTKFGTGDPIKRVDAAIMLAKALKLDLNDEPSGFKDVPKRGIEYVNALKAEGIINGKSATEFGSNDLITRGEMAIMLTRAYRMNAVTKETAFTDVGGRYREAVAALVEYHITNGKTATTFGTVDPITRGDYAIFLYKLNDMN